MLSLDDLSELVNKVSQFTDENVEQFIVLAKQEEPNLNENGLRESINDIREKAKVNVFGKMVENLKEEDFIKGVKIQMKEYEV